MPASGRRVQGRGLRPARLGIHVGPCVDEQAGHLGVAFQGGCVQRRVPPLGAGGRVRPLPQSIPHLVQVARAGGLEQLLVFLAHDDLRILFDLPSSGIVL